MDEFLIPLFLLAVLAGLVIVPVLALYAVPVRCMVRLIREPGREERVVRASWGPVAVSSSVAGGEQITRVLFCGRGVWSRAEPAAPASPSPPAGSREEPGQGPGSFLRSPAMLIELVIPVLGDAGRFFLALYRESRFDGMTGKVRIGIPNPATLGMVYGGYQASRFMLEAARIAVDVEPVFFSQLLEMDIVMRLRVRHPLVIMIRGLAIARNPAVRRSISARRAPTEGE